jgi:dynein heavy chain, axonemal
MYRECQVSFQIFQQFKIFIDKNVHKEIEQFIAKKNIRLDEYRSYVNAFNKFEALIHKVPNNIYFPMFDVSCEKAKQSIFNIIDDLRTKILSHLETQITNNMKKICEKYNNHTNYVRRSTIRAEEVEAMEKYIADLTGEKIVLKQQTSENFSKFLFLLKLEHICSENLLLLTKELYEWPAVLEKELKSNEEKHLIERGRLEESLKHQRNEFEQKMEVHGDDIKGVESFTEYNKYKSYIVEIERLEGLLEDLRKEMEEISDQEKKLFGFSSNYDKFFVLETILKPHAELWKVLGDFVHHKKHWLNSPVWTLHPMEMEVKIKTAGKAANRLGEVLDSGGMAGRIVKELKEDLEVMGGHMEIVEVLANKGLKERHWEKINEILKAKFDWKDGCLKEILGKGVDKNLKE